MMEKLSNVIMGYSTLQLLGVNTRVCRVCTENTLNSLGVAAMQTPSSWTQISLLTSQHLDQKSARRTTSFFKQLSSLNVPELTLLVASLLKVEF